MVVIHVLLMPPAGLAVKKCELSAVCEAVAG